MTSAHFLTARLPIGEFSRAAYKYLGSIVRRMRVTPTAANWAQRAEICERCPLSVIQCGKSYCGKPFTQQPIREAAVDGCGCPTHAKAKDPAEHCPLTVHFSAAQKAAPESAQKNGTCDCKWCRLAPAANHVRR